MNDKSFGGRVLSILSSLRLAVVTMVTLAAICGYATFYEMHNGTPAAQRVSRYPWTKHHTGFLIAHVGILLVLAGSLVSLYRGLDALHFVLEAPMATQEQWLVADDPQRSHLDLGMVSFGFHAARSEEEARELLSRSEGPSHLSFVSSPDGRLLFAASDASGALQKGAVEPGQPIPTGWAAMGVTVDRSLPRARLVRAVQPQAPPAKEERRQSAVRLHLEGPQGKTEPEWVLWGEQVRVAYAGQPAILAYRSPEAALPFKVTLLRFNNEPYPGSRMASTFESTVRVEDPEKGTFETLISMNHPLHHRGYIFFQSSFVEGRPMMSIFSVARAPGLPLVYLGTTLIGIGIIWMFYVKPWLAKRQAAAALAAHRARENRNEAKPADPLSARA